MKCTDTNIRTDKQRTQIIGAMMGVERKLSALVPSPDQPGQKGPLFVKHDKRSDAGGENDSMLACLAVESFAGASLGDAFAQALNVPEWASELDLSNTLEAYNEYRLDRFDNNRKASYRLGDKGAISGTFKRFVHAQAYEKDLPERMKLEAVYAHHSRALDQFETRALAYVN